MNNSEKRKISAGQILADIKSGMDESALRKKYSLSDRSLEKVYGKLIDAGLLKPSELPGSGPAGPAIEAAPPRDVTHIGWRCPVCDAPQPQRPEVCPQCGAISAKAEGRFAVGARTGRFGEPRYEEPEPSGAGKWLAVAAGVAVLLVCGMLLLKWAGHRAAPVPVGEPGLAEVPSGSVERFTAGNFEQDVIQHSYDYPVLVQFHADW